MKVMAISNLRAVARGYRLPEIKFLLIFRKVVGFGLNRDVLYPPKWANVTSFNGSNFARTLDQPKLWPFQIYALLRGG